MLIPAVVEKFLLSHIARIIREQWDPMSVSGSTNLSALLRILADECPSAKATSKRMKDLLESLYSKAKASISDEIFIPIYSKDSIEATETGCGAFLDRQYWRSIKLIRSLLCFRGVLSDAALEEMVMEGIVNRSSVMALQISAISSPHTVKKCSALMSVIPEAWLPPSRPISYRSTATFVEQLAREHASNRDFAKQSRKFIETVRQGA